MSETEKQEMLAKLRRWWSETDLACDLVPIDIDLPKNHAITFAIWEADNALSRALNAIEEEIARLEGEP